MADRVIRRRNRPNRYSDDLLLDAAADVFYRRGFHEASMVEVAAQAGATKPTLYARFGNKEALYHRVMERIADSLIAEMAAAYEGVETEGPEEATARPTRAFFDWVRANPAGVRLLFATDQGAPAGGEHRDRALARLSELVLAAVLAYLRERGARSGRATPLFVASVVGVMHHGALWAVENDALDRLDVAGYTTAFVLNGLSSFAPPRPPRSAAGVR